MLDNLLNVLYDIVKNEIFLTILSGIIVFVLSQLIMEKIIKPRDRLKEEKGKIICCLTMYANLIFNPCKISGDKIVETDVYKNASSEIRKTASEFSGLVESHPVICNSKKYSDIVSDLIGLSNGLFHIGTGFNTIEENRKCANNICKIFKIDKKF